MSLSIPGLTTGTCLRGIDHLLWLFVGFFVAKRGVLLVVSWGFIGALKQKVSFLAAKDGGGLGFWGFVWKKHVTRSKKSSFFSAEKQNVNLKEVETLRLKPVQRV